MTRLICEYPQQGHDLDALDAAERNILETIALLRKEHERHLEPLFRQLMKIQAMRRPEPILVRDGMIFLDPKQ